MLYLFAVVNFKCFARSLCIGAASVPGAAVALQRFTINRSLRCHCRQALLIYCYHLPVPVNQLVCANCQHTHITIKKSNTLILLGISLTASIKTKYKTRHRHYDYLILLQGTKDLKIPAILSIIFLIR